MYEKVGATMLTAEDQRYIADVLDKVLPPEELARLLGKHDEIVETVVTERLEKLDSEGLAQMLLRAKKLSPEKIEALKKLLNDEN